MTVVSMFWWGLLLPCSVAAQVSGQSFEVTPQAAHATVGDTVTVVFRVRLDERDLLFDTVPEPIAELPPGVRLLSVDKLVRTPDRLFHGKARVAFYRPGRQPVPVFMLPFMRAVKGVQRATLASDSAFVEIRALLPAGNPPLKDIRELKRNAGPGIGPLVAAAGIALLLLVGYGIRRRRSSSVSRPPNVPPASGPPPSPYRLALARLERTELDRWFERGKVARHYEEIVDALREYLEAAEGVPARERTTEEQLWALPPHLSEGGRRERFSDLLDEADLVKFARLEPNSAAARLFLQRAQSLLGEWHAAIPSSEAMDALR